jgi:photosystem II stability/assembly factor-like uncharacterized protein
MIDDHFKTLHMITQITKDRFFLLFAFCFLLFTDPLRVHGQQAVTVDKNTFGGIEGRHIGPAAMSGRISCLDAVNGDPRIIYVGSASGGIWKSINAGTTFKPVFDEYCQSIGAITIDQQRPDTVWAGTGETWVRNSVSVGDGIYRTTDGGKKWEKKGLENSERIARIIIHPSDPNVIYVAVMGHLWNSNPDRGVYKTTDGGTTWEKILFVDENTGCSDLAMDPDNPEVLIAGMWDYRRAPYFFRSGGPGSGLYRSTNGGKDWLKVEKGLPGGTLGRISLAFSPASHRILWALIEAERSGLYRSVDKGESWELLNNDPLMGERPFYFSLIVPDPADSNRIYKPGFGLAVSNDGGKRFSSPIVEGGNVHGDFHPMWIDPADNNFIYMGTDGGLYISQDKANTWRFVRNLPLSQFYHVSVDNGIPYHVYGGLQDNGSWMGPSLSAGRITNSDWVNIGFGDGFNVLVDPTDDQILYWQYQGGNIKRFYRDTREVKDIKPYPLEGSADLRYNWNTPLVFGPASRALYIGSQYLYRSTDRGDSWNVISPDLTTNNPDKLQQEKTGGLTIDNSSAENHCTIYTIGESPLDPLLIWVGTDDGNVQVTQNGGTSWENVSSKIDGLPSGTWCSSIEAGHFDRNAVYATFDGHRSGDMRPYVYRSADLGKTWQSIAGENVTGHCHVIREDPVDPDLLFLGTEYGFFISIDRGGTWTRFTGKMPPVPVMDMVVHPAENDLVIATHGRGIIILDDLTPIRELDPQVLQTEVAFLDSRPYVIRELGSEQSWTGDDEFTGPNSPEAAMITYYLQKRHVFGDMYLEVYNEKGEKIKTLPGSKRKGINRVAMDLRMPPPRVPSSVQLLGQAFAGPLYPPGDYKVVMVKGDKTYEGKFTILYDPDSRHSLADREIRQETIMKAYRLLEDMAFTDRRMLSLRDQALQKSSTLTGNSSLKKELTAFVKKLDALRKEFLATRQGSITGERRLREKVSDIYGDVMAYQGCPTESQITRLESLSREVNSFDQRLDQITGNDLLNLNTLLTKKQLGEIKLLTLEEFQKEN